MICSVDGCCKSAVARGWCQKHYMRWRAHGDPGVIKSKTQIGLPVDFLERAIIYRGDECLCWPFSTNNMGYAQISDDNRNTLVHRIVCSRVHGPAPADKPLSVHSCGNGHLGCITPNHLRWASHAENSADMIKHGRSTRGKNAKLTESDIPGILERIGQGESQRSIAKAFSVSQKAISKINTGKTWGWIQRGAAA